MIIIIFIMRRAALPPRQLCLSKKQRFSLAADGDHPAGGQAAPGQRLRREHSRLQVSAPPRRLFNEALISPWRCEMGELLPINKL